jgi:hypothetical protein
VRTRSRNRHVDPCWVARLLILGVVAVAAVGCTSTSGAGGDRTAPSKAPLSAPATTTSSAPGPPDLPVEATKPTREGAAAFFRYFWAVYNHAYASLDTRTLRRIYEPTCKSCQGAVDDIEGAANRGSRFVGGTVAVTAVVVAPGVPAEGLLVNGVIDQRPAHAVASDGQRGATATGSSHQRVDAAAIWDGKRWKMMGLDVPLPGR